MLYHCPIRERSNSRYAEDADHEIRIIGNKEPIRAKGIIFMSKSEKIILLTLGAALLTLSGIAPYDRVTWWLEVAPILIAVPLLVATGKRFPLTPLAYRLIFIHALILMLGGHYSYARVPLGFWVQDLLDLGRNHYDRLGHLAQGFVPAIVVREVLLRTSPLRSGKWLFFLVTSVCLSVSACYEFVEWWAALLGGEAAESFLGTQGDPWDTQWDMFLACVGAMAAQLLLGRRHDREIATRGPGREGARRRIGEVGTEA
jgi:putative membrane protein